MSQFSRLMASAATGLDPINGTDNLMELQIAPTLLDLHRMQRAPPKVIKQEKQIIKDHNDIVEKHIAGGFNREIIWRRNWKETMSELKYDIDKQNSQTLSQECSIWYREWSECK